MRGWLINGGIPLGAALITALILIVATSGHQSAAPIEIHPAELLPTPTSIVFVHVDGAVVAPGVYSLATGGRVFEAIDAAGGATEDADTGGLNLAAKITDGQKLVVPIKRVATESTDGSARNPVPAGQAPPSNPGAPTIGINTASQRILESLPGIGPVTATKIIQRRTTVGPFTGIEQLREERIVNASVYERIRTLISAD